MQSSPTGNVLQESIIYAIDDIATKVPTPVADVAGVAPVSQLEAERALEELLASPSFSKSPRMARLLRFLVAQRDVADATSLSELAIGLAVFDRDPATYFPAEDPIVRVQTGRLRDKLKAHYVGAGATATIKITIPVGQYRALLERQSFKAAAFKNHYLLAMKPVRAITLEREACNFADGFSEELAHQLFLEFGSQVVSPTFADQSATDGAASHWLEGSLRIVGERLRASFRLVDAKVGSIAWSAQFDRTACLSIGVEEHLANEVCEAVRNYYCQS